MFHSDQGSHYTSRQFRQLLYPQTNRKIDTGKTLTRWPVFVDHLKKSDERLKLEIKVAHIRTRETYGTRRLQTELAENG
ncbi:hypothetical protein, partial [Shigella flexneri]|uniref:hypothetical protein n=1 Tax=Shigella flexneri TaxID=623 RepID=UPI0033B965A9